MAKGTALKNAPRKGRAETRSPQQQGELLRPVRSEAGASGGGAPVRNAADLDRLIHERLRLGIVSALAGSQSLTFNELKAALKTTDGNLSVHARKLEEADYITCEKSFDGRTPKTEYRLTIAGRRALASYLDHMESIIHMARERRS
ncbi:MAG: winged helix-turn-helix domain-containing protein [Pyrinomonadaceae bacterium]